MNAKKDMRPVDKIMRDSKRIYLKNEKNIKKSYFVW